MSKAWVMMIAVAVACVGVAQVGLPQGSVGEKQPSSVDSGDSAREAATAPRANSDPYDSYVAGRYEDALAGFVDQQIERPEHPAIALNVGSAYYQMKNYAEAEKAFSVAAFSSDPELQAEALYNLGNTAFRQGKLEQSVELFKAALEKNPNDEDAKFNLEFVRDEIRRRHEEAKKRQEQQNQGGEGSPDEGDSQQQQEPTPESQQGEPDSNEAGEDSDGDGLSDQTERQGENPTDPTNPDTDGDGLEDGAEDLNADGKVDSGETDPNKPDSDGDGVPDGEDQGRAEGDGGASGQPQDGEGLTPEAAERYLQALQEGRPQQRRRGKQGQRRPVKDW